MVGESATCAWACLLKIPLLSLGLQWSFTVSCVGPKVPTKILLSVDGCQIIVAEGTKELGTSYFASLLKSSLISYFCI